MEKQITYTREPIIKLYEVIPKNEEDIAKAELMQELLNRYASKEFYDVISRIPEGIRGEVAEIYIGNLIDNSFALQFDNDIDLIRS